MWISGFFSVLISSGPEKSKNFITKTSLNLKDKNDKKDDPIKFFFFKFFK
jgi:hypothetical protein